MGQKKEELFGSAEDLLKGYGLLKTKTEDSGVKEERKVYLRGKKLVSNNISLFLDYNNEGKREKRYLKMILSVETDKVTKARNKEIMRQARVIANEADAKAQREENGFSIAKQSKTNLVEYILFLADEALAKTGNKRSYYYTLNSLAKHITVYSGEKTTLQQVTVSYILDFVKYLRTAKNFNFKRTGTDRDKDIILAANTQHNLFKKFGYVLKKAVKANIISKNPMEDIENEDKPEEESGTREFLTLDEIKMLIKTPCRNDLLKRAFIFCCLSGLRFSDVKQITWGDIVKDTAGDTLLRFKMQKVSRDNNIYLSDEALKWLPDRKKASDTDRIFPLTKNDSINNQLDRWCKNAGITKHITFHCSRHTAATLNLTLGVPIETVSKLLGHTKIVTTQIYASAPRLVA